MIRRPRAETGVAILCALIFAALALRVPDFRSIANFRLLSKQDAQLAIVSAGMTLVIATGGIDISVGSVLGLCAMLLGWLSARAGWSIGAACIGAVAAGGACGLVNGLLIAKGRFPAIIVTLAMFAAARAGAAMFNAGGSISDIPLSLNTAFDRTDVLGLPLLLWLGVAALLLCSMLLRRTVFGRALLALGGNRAAATMSGIAVGRVEIAVYALSGAFAGLAAVINTAMKATATPDAGVNLELTAIAAVVLGGTSIAGGRATLLGTALGVATIGGLISGVRLMGREDQVAWFLVGMALLLAVEIQQWRPRRKRRSVTGAGVPVPAPPGGSGLPPA